MFAVRRVWSQCLLIPRSLGTTVVCIARRSVVNSTAASGIKYSQQRERLVTAQKLLNLGRERTQDSEKDWVSVTWKDDDPIFLREDLLEPYEKRKLAKLYKEQKDIEDLNYAQDMSKFYSVPSTEKTWLQDIDHLGRSHGTGRRKAATARAIIKRGEGIFRVNGTTPARYFLDMGWREHLLFPFMAIDSLGDFDVRLLVRGGGLKGQAEAARLAIARALQRYNPGWRPLLRNAGLLTVDPRSVERKHYGRKKARKAKQWKKR